MFIIFIIIIIIVICCYRNYQENQKKNNTPKNNSNQYKRYDASKTRNVEPPKFIYKRTEKNIPYEAPEPIIQKKKETIMDEEKIIIKVTPEPSISQQESSLHFNSQLESLGFRTSQQPFFKRIPKYNRELITKLYSDNSFLTNVIPLYQKPIVNNQYEGEIKISLDHSIVLIELNIANPLDPQFKNFYFDKNDVITISLYIDFNLKICDFLVSKIKGQFKNFEEIGNYLYNYPSLTINRFGITQFSYMYATKLTTLLITTLKNSIPNIEEIFIK